MINDTISAFIEDQVYSKVPFYKNSDGYYLGEHGTVLVTLNGDEFMFTKQSTSNFEQIETRNIFVEITNEEVAFLKKYIHSFGSRIYGGLTTWNYKIDLLLTHKMVKLQNEIETKIESNEQFIKYADGFVVNTPIQITLNRINVEIWYFNQTSEYNESNY